MFDSFPKKYSQASCTGESGRLTRARAASCNSLQFLIRFVEVFITEILFTAKIEYKKY